MMRKIYGFTLVVFLLISVFINSAFAFDLKDLDISKFFVAKKLPELTKDKPARAFGQVNKKNLEIGDPFEYTVTVYQKPDVDVKVEVIELKKDKENDKSDTKDKKTSNKSDKSIIVSKKRFQNIKYNSFEEKTDILKSKNIKVTKYTYHLQPKTIDNVKIPALDVFINGKKYSLSEVNLKPKSVLDKNNPMKDIHDIKPIEEYFIFRWEWLYFPFIILLFLILIIALVIFIIKNLPSKKHVEEIKPPHQIAYERLNKLKKMDLKTSEDYDRFYIKLSEIMREYLEGRFYIKAIEMTTEEISRELLSMNLNLKTRKMMTTLLGESDLVKFAKFLPDKKQAFDNIMIAYDFVDMTKLDFSLMTEKGGI